MRSVARTQKLLANPIPFTGREIPSAAWAWAGLCVAILFVVMVRVLHLDLPLDRDEGEHAYLGQLILEGVAPYKLAYNLKLPGMYAANALIMAVFGQSAEGIHFGLLVVNVAAVVLVFVLGRRLFADQTALVAAVTYALMSQGLGVLGWTAHATHFVVLAALAGLWVLFRAIESGRGWQIGASGFLFGLAFLFKQPGLLFGAFAGAVLWVAEWRARPGNWRGCLKKSLWFCGGLVLPYGLTCLILWRAGVFAKFWFWTAICPSLYSGTLESGWKMLRIYFEFFSGRERVLWGLAGLGLVPLFCLSISPARKIGLLGFVTVSVVAVCLGLHFYAHHFVLGLPAVSLLVGLAISGAGQVLKKFSVPGATVVVRLVFLAVCAFVIVGERNYLFPTQPVKDNRLFFGGNPCREVLAVADYIKVNSTPANRIAVIGSEPAIYFYSHRRSATGHLFTYLLMRRHSYALSMQQEMIQEIEAAKPEFLVWVSDTRSWLATPDSNQTIIQWANRYTRDAYDLVGVADQCASGSVYRWGAEAGSYKTQSDSFILVFRRQAPLSRAIEKQPDEAVPR